MRRIILVIALCALVVMGFSQNENSTKQSTIYFYRPWLYYGLAVGIDLYVNDNFVGKLSNSGKFVYNLPMSGNVKIKTKGSGALYHKFTEIIISVESGKSYFVKAGWNSSLSLTAKTYVNQVSYDEVKKKFPELKGEVDNNDAVYASNTSETIDKKNQIDTQNNIRQAQTNEAIVQNKSSQTNNQLSTNKINIKQPTSEVDTNIPINKVINPYKYALIVGNEDYNSYQNGLSSEVNVPFAANDARVFKEYAMKTLGIPQENIILLLNAKAIEMNRSIKKINLYAKNSNGKAEIVMYYAGHGFPDEVSKEPYLIPVDVSGTDLEFAVKLKDLYASLSEFPTQKITVFIDACFSGGARDQGLVATRGVKVKAKDEVVKGNMVVFTASSAEQSSLAYKDKQHGMFTYYLLKKLQETKGNVSYKNLSDYLKEQIGLNSIRINDKEQNPQTIISSDIQTVWGQWSIATNK